MPSLLLGFPPGVCRLGRLRLRNLEDASSFDVRPNVPAPQKVLRMQRRNLGAMSLRTLRMHEKRSCEADRVKAVERIVTFRGEKCH